MAAMNDTGKIVRHVRRRLRFVESVERFQRFVLPAGAGVLLLGASLHLLGHGLGAGALLLAGTGAVAGVALAAVLATRVSEARAAAEADAILGTRERLSTAWALRHGHAQDPLGFAPILEAEAERIARTFDPARVRAATPVRVRPRTGLALLLLFAALFLPLVPTPPASAAEEPESIALKKEKERVAEALRRVERQFGKTEIMARDADMKNLEKLALEIRKEVSRLADERPTRAKALARMADLERRASDAARDLADMPRAEAAESRKVADEELAELKEAIERFLAADPKNALAELSALAQKLANSDLEGMSGESLRQLAEAMRRMQAALGQMQTAASGESGEAGRDGENGDREGKGPLGTPLTAEQMARLAKALDRMAKALESGKADASALQQLMGAASEYRDLQLTPEQIEEMLKSMEELARMCEAGENLSGAKGMMGGFVPMPGLGTGSLPGGPQGTGGGAGKDEGAGTGGAGRGRGGHPGIAKDDRETAPDFDPGMLNEEGTANFFRTVRRMPSREESPREYETLVRQASREAEEAIRRGDIPRRYREYVRRFFGSPEGR